MEVRSSEGLGRIQSAEASGLWVDVPLSECWNEAYQALTDELGGLLPIHLSKRGGADLDVRMRKSVSVWMHYEKTLHVFVPLHDELAREEF